MAHSPVVIIGLDAGDPDFIEQWASEGQLPTIAGLMKRGCWGRTAGPEHVCEIGTGLSLFSGISRSRHGYYYFRQLRPGTYDLQAFSAHDAGTLPFWAHLRGREKRVAAVDPPDGVLVPGLPGIQLLNWAVSQISGNEISPSADPHDLLQEAARVFGPRRQIADFKVNSSLSEDREVYGRLMERIEKKGALCRHLLARDRFDLIVTEFYESHAAGHRFWKYRAESQASAGLGRPHELRHAIRDVYRAIDRQMGLLLDALPQESNVFILSCYGMESQYPTTGLISAFCRQLGYQAAPDSGPPAMDPLALARRLMPESWRVAISHHLPHSAQERLLADHFRRSTSWPKTTAFAIPSLYTSYIRVNLQGREPQGIVQPGAEYTAMLDHMEADLKSLIDPVTGEPAVAAVVRTSEWFRCGPPTSLPDLFVEWKPGSHFVRRLTSPKAELQQREPGYFRDSFHSFQGFIAAAGPAISQRGAIGRVSLLDLAPTFLSLLGEPIPAEMTGRPIHALQA